MAWLIQRGEVTVPQLGPESPATDVQQLKNGMNVIAALLRKRNLKARVPLVAETKSKPAKRTAEKEKKGTKPLPKAKPSPKPKPKASPKPKSRASPKPKPKAQSKPATQPPKQKAEKKPPPNTKQAKAPRVNLPPTVGKGGTKGHGRVFAQLQQNLRLARKAGVKRMSANIVEEMREAEKGNARPLFEDELERLIPVEVRRSRPDAGVGKPPQDRVVRQVLQKDPTGELVKISLGDASLVKQILVNPLSDAPCVRHGAQIRARITAACRDQGKSLDERLLHGPQVHSWVAGSGARCQLIELMVTSMQLGETCVTCSRDSSLYADSGLRVVSDKYQEVEYAISMEDVGQPLPREASGLITWALEEKSVAAHVLKEGLVHLALQKYLVLSKELDMLGPSTESCDAVTLRRTCRLNAAICFLRLSRWHDVISTCSELLAEDAGMVKALYLRGQAHLQLKNLEGAKQDFSHALELDPSNAEIEKKLESCQRALLKADARKESKKERSSNTLDKWS
ncbi:Peptidyl-prolyl cis-trans isomerase PASTICCINO1 (70 kDa peptidyl-prolyl isomerase) (FK506-binding protein 72) (AtFKBP72) (Immunophilin FKBP72) (Peptidyl-prolyl cis-trans isomerase FKBP72) (PPIase FKBP72) (Rotamase) [Durusdinium trenchii]|uniref:peptidylprolyl isomerase n=1 Tax=Durusdinium trenchii TaxID=1381693 RepID=A0ABP0RD06_9DINO